MAPAAGGMAPTVTLAERKKLSGFIACTKLAIPLRDEVLGDELPPISGGPFGDVQTLIG
jgi:hypothetical protein